MLLPTTQVHVILLALLSLFRVIAPEYSRIAINNNLTQIEESARLGFVTYNVPPGILLSVAFKETHLGTIAGSGGNWGAPSSPQHRQTPGTPLHAARALSVAYERCGHSWVGAIGRFRSGLCRPTERGHIAYVIEVSNLINRVYRAAHLPSPLTNERIPSLPRLYALEPIGE